MGDKGLVVVSSEGWLNQWGVGGKRSHLLGLQRGQIEQRALKWGVGGKRSQCLGVETAEWSVRSCRGEAASARPKP